MIQLPLKYVSSLLSAETQGNMAGLFQGVSIDSRTLLPGNLFFALKGERFNGHDFLKEASKKGASGAVVMQKCESDLPLIEVSDTTIALGLLAKNHRLRFILPVIAVTGSNGKTTTKNMLQAIFTAASGDTLDAVLATKGNRNNHIGMPLTLLELSASHRYAIIEMGMNHSGEIQYLSDIAKPVTAIITNAGPSHLDGVGGDIDGVARAKGEIFTGLSENGIAVINADDNFADYWRNLCSLSQRQIITFGMKNPADVRGECTKEGFTLFYREKQMPIRLRLLGRHNMMNALAASAGALANGIELSCIKKALEQLSPTPRRMEPKQGRGGVYIIDDTYNANPLSLEAALETVSQMSGTKVLVLGDMRELGEQAAALHLASGEKARALGIDFLFATGELTKHTVKSFGQNAFHFEQKESLINALTPFLNKEVIMLVKGSFSMKMDEIIQAIVS